ncbi:bifunctional heptose 7-phosphate kinase/heptose 1-phosphate adenyltransferase [Daejeonella sp.]|uniref:bifunctional heptose 7-phosphate kinase/heptose 1-phosphate adenyltransferase n=1 Tax=Daejeonella sp. TaxID=2805397 RepID=UPI00272F93BD|nr:bifunctional ADP-heptose synthase [Daejeonella sp.]MDP2414533.1 bifunctional ADP-heptose synthase [Daejeonella sp.]
MTDIFEKFNSLNIMIIGDVMMDSYIWGKVERVSPEAPVPVVKVSNKENRLGGAANVALNVQSLGGKPFICAIIGDDKDGEEFLSLLRNQNLSEQGILKIKNRPTTVKTRIIAHNQQIVRVDVETDENISEAETEVMIGMIKKILAEQKIDAIIFEDYDKGLITEKLISETAELAEHRGIITVVDPKKRNFHSYKGVHLFKPNLKELEDGLKMVIDSSKPNQVENAISKLKSQLGARAVMLTLSEKGVFINSDLGQRHVAAHKRDIADVSGAGDTVIATAALCLAAGLDEFKASEIANLAGGLVCEHVGVVPIDKARLLEESRKL